MIFWNVNLKKIDFKNRLLINKYVFIGKKFYDIVVEVVNNSMIFV